MTHARLLRFDLEDPVHARVPCAALIPDSEPHAVCLLLYGGGGSPEMLADLQPTFEAAWSRAQLEPCILITPDVGPWSFYLDDPPRGYAWESFIVQRLVPHARELGRTSGALGIAGMSMGGYGALKLAFKHPQLFAAVGAVSPMLEPYAQDPNTVSARNRFFYPPEVPQALLGTPRDVALYRADHPIERARALRQGELAIYIDAAGEDAVNAHDGAESLHRALWDLDIAHEYHLRRDSDHAGPDLASRVVSALHWVVQHLQPTAAVPSPLREQLAPQRTAAARQDPSVHRRYGPRGPNS